jgi:hypothetical protein
MVVEGIVLERQQHEVAPTWILGGRDTDDDGHQGPDVLDANSLSMEVAIGGGVEHASGGARLTYCRHWCWCWCRRWCWCYSCSRMRWRCSDSEDGSKLELEGGSSHLLGLDLGGGDVHLKGCEGSGEVDRSSGSV